MSTGKAAYFNGGQAEKIFQSQLDELMIEKLSETSGGIFSDVMFEQQFPEFADDDAGTQQTEGTNSRPVGSHSGESSVGSMLQLDVGLQN